MTPIPNEKLVQILRAVADCSQVLPRGEFRLDIDADGNADVVVVDRGGQMVDHVATCSTNEMDRYLVALPPAVANAMAQELLHTRGLVAELLVALRRSSVTAGLDFQVALAALMTSARALPLEAEVAA